MQTHPIPSNSSVISSKQYENSSNKPTNVTRRHLCNTFQPIHHLPDSASTQQHASDAAPRAAFVLPLGRLCRSFQPILPMSPVVCLQGAWDGAPAAFCQVRCVQRGNSMGKLAQGGATGCWQKLFTSIIGLV